MKKWCALLLTLSLVICCSLALAEDWTCLSCGNAASGNFCNNCGSAKPSNDWICSACGNAASGNFCSNCGAARNNNGAASNITPPSTSVADGIGVSATGMYSYLHDKWDLYKATVISSNAVKIENWYRFTANEETPFKLDHSVLVVNPTDGTTDFKWLNPDQTAFSITMSDAHNSRFKQPTLVVFSAGDYGEAVSTSHYEYLHDKWDQYRAFQVADNVIKIENWYRFSASEGNEFNLDHSVLVVVTDDRSTDFTWLDDAHTSFSLTMSDPENSRFTDPTLVLFTIAK